MENRIFETLCRGLGRLSEQDAQDYTADRRFSPFAGYGYAGEWEDDNGLVYLRARYYDHETGRFLSLDPVEGSMNDPISLNGYVYADDNPTNNTDPSGTQTIPPEIRINQIRALLRGGYPEDQLVQQPCRGISNSPFGCDQNGNPIEYVVVRGFAGPYSKDATKQNCAGWGDIKGFNDKHCGIDMASYSDAGFLWNILEGSQIRISEHNNYYLMNLDDYTYNGRPLSLYALLSGQVKVEYQGYNPAIPTGRNAYAISPGHVTEWDASSATLKVKVSDGLEVQYTHLGDCNGVQPNALVDQDISAQQQLGCYGFHGRGVGSEPHLHITFKQIGIQQTDLCHPEDIYLNPVNPVDTAGTTNFSDIASLWTPSRNGALPPHILRHGYAHDGQEWTARGF